MAVTETVKIEGDAKGLEDTLNKLNDSTEKLADNISEVSSIAKKGFDNVGKGAKSAAKAVEATKGGISKLVGAIKSLTIIGVVGDTITEVFTGNQKVVDFFNVTINTIKILFSDLAEVVFPAVADALDRIFKDPVQAIKDFGSLVVEYGLNLFKQMGNSVSALGSAILAFFKGDFAEASKLAKEAFSEVVDGIVGVEEGGIEKIQKAAERLTKRVKEAIKDGEKLNELEKAAAKADVERQKIQLKAQTLAEKQRQARDDEFASIQERIDANEKLGKILEQQYLDEAAQIDKKVAFAQAQYNINKTPNNVKLRRRGRSCGLGRVRCIRAWAFGSVKLGSCNLGHVCCTDYTSGNSVRYPYWERQQAIGSLCAQRPNNCRVSGHRGIGNLQGLVQLECLTLAGFVIACKQFRKRCKCRQGLLR